MKFGLSLFAMNPREYGTVARTAEACGFDSVWMPEHLVFPAEIPPTYPYSEDGQAPVRPGAPLYDPWVTLAYIAASTTTLRLGTHVYILPLRHPLVTARAVTTLDVLSNGRAVLGAGVGWLAEEFALAGESFEDRGARADEIVALLRRMWTEKVVEHHGRFYDLAPFRFEPKPVQRPHPPILIGGESRVALRRAARLGDGWLGATHDLEEARRVVAELGVLRREAGREREPFEIGVVLPPATGLDRAKELRDLGVSSAILMPPVQPGVRLTAEAVSDFLERSADEILRRL